MFIDVSIVVAGWALESSLTRPKPMTYDFKQLQNLPDAQCLHHLNEGDDNSSITGLFWKLSKIMRLWCEDYSKSSVLSV